jgi:hypothetical protein
VVGAQVSCTPTTNDPLPGGRDLGLAGGRLTPRDAGVCGTNLHEAITVLGAHRIKISSKVPRVLGSAAPLTRSTVTVTTQPMSPIMAPRIAESTDEAVDGVKVRAAGISILLPALAAAQPRSMPARAPSSGTSQRLWRTLWRRRNRAAQVVTLQAPTVQWP